MKINRLNIGEEVRKKVEESGLSKAKFAELLLSLIHISEPTRPY